MDAPRQIPRRNKGFDETHRELIETAVRLISERGTQALSIAAVAREMGINRTTVYYHFDSREALLHAVSSWATEQLGKGMDDNLGQPERLAHISRFVLDNPELIKLWIDDFVTGPEIRDSCSCWDVLVDGAQLDLAEANPGESIDARIYCVMLLAAAVIAPRVYRNAVDPEATTEEIVTLFVREHQRVLHRDGLTGQKRTG